MFKTLNLKFSPFHLASYVKELYLNACHTWSRIYFPHSTYHIIFFWGGVVEAVVVAETPYCVQCGCLLRFKWLCIGFLCTLCSL